MAKFAKTKALNTKLHNAEIDVLDLILAVGKSFFSKATQTEKVAVRFGATSAPYLVTQVKDGVLVEVALELGKAPAAFFGTVLRALIDVEYHLTNPEKNALSKASNKDKKALMKKIGESRDWTLDDGVFYINRKGTAEKRCKDFLKAAEAFQIDGRLIERMSLKQLDKMAAADPEVAAMLEKTKRAQAEAQKGRQQKSEDEKKAARLAKAIKDADARAILKALKEAGKLGAVLDAAEKSTLKAA